METILEKPKQKRYIEPFSFELAGKVYTLESQEERCFLNVFDEEFLCWKEEEKPAVQAEYRAQKLCEDLYLLSFVSEGQPVALTMDLSTSLFTIIAGESVSFGRIREADRAQSFPLHSFCRDLSGHAILWRYSPQDCLVYRHTDDTVQIDGEEIGRKYISVKLREDFYLLYYEIAHGKGNCVMIADLNRVHGVGRYTRIEDGEAASDYFAGYGDFLRPGEKTKQTSYKKRILGIELYNPVSKRESPRAMQQYRIPETNELAGRALELSFDGLGTYFIHFIDKFHLAYAKEGEMFRYEKYEAVKSDETTYLFKFLLSGSRPVTSVSIVWDRLSTLATCILAQAGANPEHPRLVTSKAYFGAEKRGRLPLSAQRHCYTDELVGKRVEWKYNQSDSVMHCYHGEDHFRLGNSEKVLAPDAPEREIRHWEYLTGRTKIYPFYEEPAYFIKIKEGMYLYSVTESNINHLIPEAGGGQMLILLNCSGPRYIGRDFGVLPDGTPDFKFIGAIGSFCDEPDSVEAEPYPIYSFKD